MLAHTRLRLPRPAVAPSPAHASPTPAAPAVDAFRENLEDLERQVGDIAAEAQQLERVTTEAVSLDVRARARARVRARPPFQSIPSMPAPGAFFWHRFWANPRLAP